MLIEESPTTPAESHSGVLIPQGTRLSDEEKYKIVKFISAANDCEQFLKNFNKSQPMWATQTGSDTGDDEFTLAAKNGKQVSLVVDSSMVEEVKIENQKYNIIHQNYVIGIIGE